VTHHDCKEHLPHPGINRIKTERNCSVCGRTWVLRLVGVNKIRTWVPKNRMTGW
jgi:hypothetical protein